MSVKKFIAPTARQALREIRNELGEDAVILSNHKVDQGVEIIALANEDISRMTGQSSTPVAFEPKVKASSANVSPATGNEDILGEIKTMHSMLQQQISVMSWNDVQQRDPQSAGLLRRMLNAGFSSMLARQLIDKMAVGKMHGETWIKQVLKRNLHVVGENDDVVAKGGVYALIGPTGVGKTTTTAKLAARAVVRYGADKVALLTTDSYRIGAFEQLKIYGKILGVAVHAVKDTDDLRLTLSALRHKHLVLIDTVGMGQRDERVTNQNEMFDATDVKRLLLLNSTSSGDTLEEVVRMYHSNTVIGCIATKLDEAVTLGAMLDVVVRHSLVMHYMANGQRVPEDLHSINLDYLLHRAIKSKEQMTPFTLQDVDFPILMANEGKPSGARTSGNPGKGKQAPSMISGAKQGGVRYAF
jgi:flagellar biosynthesis protein FlhF